MNTSKIVHIKKKKVSDVDEEIKPCAQKLINKGHMGI